MCSSHLPVQKSRRHCLRSLKVSIAFIAGYIQAANSYVGISQTVRAGGHDLTTLSSRSRCFGVVGSLARHTALKQQPQDRDTYGDLDDGYYGNSNYIGKNGEGRAESPVGWEERARDNYQNESTSASQNPDRAISIVSELKANAALFAAFAYGSLNLPNTLTVSESKVTSVTTSLSISRPLPDSDLIRSFVVLDVCTLCLMISCVAASQLLIYRLTDGSYEDFDENCEDAYNSQMNLSGINDGSKRRKNSRESALGRLVTTYRSEFTVARISFDLGLVTLLFSVGVRSLAIFDEDIVLPIAIVIGITAVFLAVAYVTTYVEVFRTAENLTSSPFFSLPFPFTTETKKNGADDNAVNADDSVDVGPKNPMISTIFLPISLISVGLGLYFTLLSTGSDSGSNLSRLGPYDVTSGATKLKVVTDKIDSEKGKVDTRPKRQERRSSLDRPINRSKKERAKAASEKAQAEAARKKAADAEAKKKSEDDAKRKAEEDAKKKAEEELRKKTEDEAKKKAEEEMMKRLEKEARRIAEEEADAASAAAKAKTEAALGGIL